MNKIKIFFASIVVFSTFLVCPLGALAATILSPIISIEAEPGQTQRGVIKVFNESGEDMYLIASIEAFTVDNELGQPRFYQPDQENDFLSWISLDAQDIILKPGQTGIVPFSVNIPDNTLPQGYYAAVFWQQVAQTTGQPSPVGISGKVGALLLITVNGELTMDGELVDFYLADNKKVVLGLPIVYAVRFNNTGNVHQAPAGEIVLKNIFGLEKKIIFNPDGRTVLPGSLRRFEAIWPAADYSRGWTNFFSQARQELTMLVFGPHVASLYLNYGQNYNDQTLAQISFWVIPWRAILLLVILLSVLGLMLKIRSFAYQKKSSPPKQ